MSVTQEDINFIRQEMLEEAKEAEQYECMMGRIECFLEADMILEAIKAMGVVNKACKEYEHDWSDVAEYIGSESWYIGSES